MVLGLKFSLIFLHVNCKEELFPANSATTTSSLNYIKTVTGHRNPCQVNQIPCEPARSLSDGQKEWKREIPASVCQITHWSMQIRAA